MTALRDSDPPVRRSGVITPQHRKYGGLDRDPGMARKKSAAQIQGGEKKEAGHKARPKSNREV